MRWRDRHEIDRRKWAQLRCQVLNRDGWRCAKCGKAGRLEVDHKKPLDVGGSRYDLDNLQALCRGCHIDKTRRENRARRPVDPGVLRWRELVART